MALAALVTTAAYLLGVMSAIDALFKPRQPQAKVAWILGLLFMPFFVLPLYWIFGRRKFAIYAEATAKFHERTADVRRQLSDLAESTDGGNDPNENGPPDSERLALEELSRFKFCGGNELSLLIDGDETFKEMFAAIDAAENYVLVQFYIVRDDEIGTSLRDVLVRAIERGVRVYFLYDDIGCIALSSEYKQSLRDASAEVCEFSGGRVWLGRFRLNFRNHRKIVIVDGQVGFVGGFNVGDEYLGRDEAIGNWRDTHLQIDGPSVAGLQYTFCRDWFFATQQLPDLEWRPKPRESSARALTMSSGPESELENCGLLYAHLIGSAERRLWIASPYFVPDGRILGALQLAAFRGVDVRILVPRRTDNLFFKFVPFAFFHDAMKAGVKIFFYEKDFMHQKIVLVDDAYGVVSSANLDNRSFYLNFEVACIVHDRDFCSTLETMLARDLEDCTEIAPDDVTARTLPQRFATHVTALLAPVL